MTLGEWVRKSGDEELAALLINWMITILATMGIDYTQLRLNTEFHELVNYLQQPVEEDIINALKIFTAPYSEKIN